MKNTPLDYISPDWEKTGLRDKVHNWRNYVSIDLQCIWCSLDDNIKKILAENFNDIASQEEWDH